jgi:hypothetical protein
VKLPYTQLLDNLQPIGWRLRGENASNVKGVISGLDDRRRNCNDIYIRPTHKVGAGKRNGSRVLTDACLVRPGTEGEEWTRYRQRKPDSERERIRLSRSFVVGGKRFAVAAVQKDRLPVGIVDFGVILHQNSSLKRIRRDGPKKCLLLPRANWKCRGKCVKMASPAFRTIGTLSDHVWLPAIPGPWY